ncbi:hypothetical protein M758_9G018800 [Ceratodon purpureus]|uniref:Uncharacterized protein n=1 Tax=Ceratodon purpureus TaxID=3225 RepID=A0A8T0GPB5_CERPU|nr:hypothetical protein KC19_9G018800 [Ceratodon purpureus]KAG0604912.1 hypothetical protein M758_9G018800 [Ceratodon purpureus]
MLFSREASGLSMTSSKHVRRFKSSEPAEPKQLFSSSNVKEVWGLGWNSTECRLERVSYCGVECQQRERPNKFFNLIVLVLVPICLVKFYRCFSVEKACT